ncbi:MAG: glycosyltransferase family 2 protein [Alphaproteobacteria bacterium]|uniref:glycosyltransferase family 2 protein n=1 Tax=Celeribacter baekdonensis TaxID=875171 RepID=UPI000944CF0A|nr:glycosyltransferase family 2 protein [Celeribacter baekdonensis]MBU0642686.1 glycosyltransferase family 2 protein [Alphaproteobacteria bacterium]MBU1277581.1 glycosyltransferase family 2 protein [Alphaproteobacteria bacterium]MBU1573460.1 glycosyltransferase family 2 protein [Alphaproteobacteria bacterium]MBU1828919.1 glycosyltransferase family 2 protein [Alphaproteobacteria bacterium]MBU2077008.1 glycosyltransferase family 2 protein [Alphaproteobacteria bacterium]
MRLRRKHRLIRAYRKSRELTCLQNHTDRIKKNDVLLVCTLRNERIRLPYFMKYYRDMGVSHFLFVDNDSDDGSREFLIGQQDVSIWHTTASYRKSLFGVHWMNALARKYCHGHWTLTVDVDEFFAFPFCDTRPIPALTDWLDNSGLRSFSAMLIDMYPKGPIDAQPYIEGQNPFEIAEWFDSGNYMLSTNWEYENLWIQGGPRARLFFHNDPINAPSLNKIPLVKWDRSYVYLHSTHMLLPKRLNKVYDSYGGEMASGVLLHAKFLNTFVQKTEEELKRRQHYAGSREYLAYSSRIKDDPDLWCNWSEKYINWRQLEILGLMSKGNWA